VKIVVTNNTTVSCYLKAAGTALGVGGCDAHNEHPERVRHAGCRHHQGGGCDGPIAARVVSDLLPADGVHRNGVGRLMCMMLAPVGDGILPLGTQAPYKSVRLADDGGTTQPTTPTWEPMVADHFFQPYSTWWGGDNILGNALAAWNVQNNGAGSTSVTPQIDETKPFAVGCRRAPRAPAVSR
jgi:hypothetical protein